MAKKITLGFEVKTGKRVDIPLSHLIATGVTQLSGKSTTIEALIKRSGMRAIVFKTKIGEKSFVEGTQIAPFFKDRSDYEFIRSIIEAYAREKLYLEKGTLMRLCQGAGTLLEIKRRVDDTITEGITIEGTTKEGKSKKRKLRGIEEEIYTRLQHYLGNIIPQIQYANFSKTLNLVDGVNIMDLERFTEEVQSLIIQAVATEVLENQRDIIIVIPEAWKFISQKYNNPCKRAVESFVRQGATNNNYIFIDSQDMAGVDKQPLKQVSTWILGFQSERNEVKHTLDQISLPKKMKPKEDEIMTLKVGHFILSTQENVTTVYVWPTWMKDSEAIKVAKGEIDVEEIKKPDSLTPYSVQTQEPETGLQFTQQGLNTIRQEVKNELVGIRTDFFDKIQDITNFINKVQEKVFQIETSRQEVNIDEIVSKVLQKMPTPNGNGSSVDVNSIVNQVLARVPTEGGKVYEVAPLEKIQKDFLTTTKNKILSDIGTLNNEQKKILKFIETQKKGCNQSFIIEKCLFLKATSGGTRERVSKECREMTGLGIMRMDKNSICYPHLMGRITELMGTHNASQQELETTYSHILLEILGGSNGSKTKE